MVPAGRRRGEGRRAARRTRNRQGDGGSAGTRIRQALVDRCGTGHHRECGSTAGHDRGRCCRHRRRKPRSAEAPKKAEACAAPAPKADAPLSPAVRKMVEENKVDTSSVAGTGKDGRITKGDVIAHLEKPAAPAPIPAPSPRSRACGARPRPRRCRAGGAREDVASAPHHRAPPQGCAEHRRHAHHLQRGGHDGDHGAPEPVQGPVREEARREAGLHELLREGLHRRR
jgi:pyruvate/2-oxoglutarate dehydrogenase complex dihydrolipoamide acyltransferase (E2) component